MDAKRAIEIRELADRARHLAVDARINRSTDEAVLKAIEALAEAVKLLAGYSAPASSAPVWDGA